ncbi:MAG: IS3 family transposase [Acidobacteria bacterium]|nr:IS3 family transposase [Acidobacteriota bacterium]
MQGNACNPQSLLPLEERRAGKREIADLKLVASIREIQRQTHGVYGSPRVTLALRNRGQAIGKNRVARVMRLHGIQAKTAHKYKATTNSQHGLPVAPNLLERSFAVGQEQSVWVSDITYIWTREGWLYLCAILELSTRAILGWSIQPRLTRHLVLNALNMACYRKKPVKDMIFHSDRGSQYASEEVKKRLIAIGARQSMSRKGDCWDNAVMESFFGSLKREWVRSKTYSSRLEAKSDVAFFIEGFYNTIRIHTTLGTSPKTFQKQHQVA